MEHSAAKTGKWHKMGLGREHFPQNRDRGEWSNDTTHPATLQRATSGDVCGVTCNSLCLKSRLNFKLGGRQMGMRFSILLPKMCYNTFFFKQG